MVHAMLAAYTSKTPQRARVVDAFLACILVTALAQAVYGCVITTFPYYSYLAGIFCTLGLFALTGMFSALRWRWSSPHRCAASLRVQLVNSDSKAAHNQAFAEYVACSLLLFFVVVHFMG